MSAEQTVQGAFGQQRWRLAASRCQAPMRLQQAGRRWRAAQAAADRWKAASAAAVSTAAGKAIEADRMFDRRRLEVVHAARSWQQASDALRWQEARARARARAEAIAREEAAARASEQAATELRIKRALEAMPLFDMKMDVFVTRCSRSYLHALANWHTLLVLLCQPHPPIGQFHRMDLEMHVQCFWSHAMLELGLLAMLDAHLGAEEHTDDGEGATDTTPASPELIRRALVAALLAAVCALAVCRLVFVTSGTAGRVANHIATHGGLRAGPSRCTCSAVDGVWAPGRRLFAWRALRSAVGWLTAWGVFVSGAALCYLELAGLPMGRARAVLSGWAIAQLLTWALVEPLGIASALLILRAPSWCRAMRSTVHTHPRPRLRTLALAWRFAPRAKVTPEAGGSSMRMRPGSSHRVAPCEAEEQLAPVRSRVDPPEELPLAVSSVPPPAEDASPDDEKRQTAHTSKRWGVRIASRKYRVHPDVDAEAQPARSCA